MLEHIKHLSNYLLLFVLIVFTLNSKWDLCLFAVFLTASHIASITSNIVKDEERKHSLELLSSGWVIVACLIAISNMTLNWT